MMALTYFFSKWYVFTFNLLDVLSKYREMSCMFKTEDMECKRELFICEMHYAEDDIKYTKQRLASSPPNNEFALKITGGHKN